MNKGISLHIGLNYVDPNVYNGWNGELAGCINDSVDMQSIATSQGFQSARLNDSQATSGNVVSKINEAAQNLKSGDYFLLTYSGHGGQVPDETGEEVDGKNETWVLWDRQLLDNELYLLWSRFAAGVKIFVLSDSCHSGTVVRQFLQKMILTSKQLPEDNSCIPAALTEKEKLYRSFTPPSAGQKSNKNLKLRYMDLVENLKNYNQERNIYRSLKIITGPKDASSVKASLIFISGCQDDQFSYDGDDNGLFTSKVLSTWNNGQYSGSHSNFFDQISSLMPPYQTPNYLTLGAENTVFVNQRPFTIQTSNNNTGNTNGSVVQPQTSSTLSPTLEISNTWKLEDGAPKFGVKTGQNPYYYVELAAESRLFDSENYGNNRNIQNFYATWADGQVSNRLTDNEFILPAHAWNNLKRNDRLFYRIGTTSSLSGWENFEVSVEGRNHASAPSFKIISNTDNANINNPTSQGNDCGLIKNSVGEGMRNNKGDVKMVQNLLNDIDRSEGGPRRKLIEDGLWGSKTGQAIKDLQSHHGISSDELGIVSPNSQTLNLLSSMFAA